MTRRDAANLVPARILIAAATRRIARRGLPPDVRPDIDTASLVRRFPAFAAVTITDIPVTGPHGVVPTRLYRSDSPAHGALVWTHGGAFIGGDLEMPESNWVALELASRGIPVLAVDYRKALRGVRYPIPVDDMNAAWLHAAANAGELFGVPAARVHLGGASAGATLAGSVALRTRNAHGPMPASLVLAYPFLHPALPAPSPEAITATAKLTGILRFRPRVVSAVSRHYAGPMGIRDPLAFVGLAEDLAGLPPTCVLIAAIDDLRSSGEQFARQLAAAGVPVEVIVEKSATHGHLNHPEARSAQRSIRSLAAWIEAIDSRSPLH